VLRRTETGQARAAPDELALTRGSPGRSSRRLLLRRALAATGALGVGAVAARQALVAPTASAASEASDVRILNFLLLLEEVQHAFHAKAGAGAALGPRLRRFARVTAAQDGAHARMLRSSLGDRAGAKPRLQFGDATRRESAFVPAALKLKEATVAAYIGQGANLTASRITQVASIVSVDARHAAWIRALAGELPAPRASDPAKDASDVLDMIERWGYVART
jgi:hypothetical protein